MNATEIDRITTRLQTAPRGETVFTFHEVFVGELVTIARNLGVGLNELRVRASKAHVGIAIEDDE